MPWRNELLEQHSARKSAGLWRQLRRSQSSPGRTITAGGKSFLNFCSNNYLSLSTAPEVISAASASIDTWGASTSASHLIVGHTQLHQELEEKLASFVGAQQAVLFSTGYMANLAVPSTFLGRSDLIVQDKLNHASIIDGAQLCLAQLRRYAHRDTAAASKLLAADHPRKLLITDGVFSMDGDIAPLADLKTACDQTQSVMLVDDAHGLATIGDGGRGSLSHHRLRPAGNVLMLGTLSKALGSFGAFVAGDAVYIESLIQHARPFIYTTALPCSAVAAALAALDLLQTQPWRQEKLHDNIQTMRDLSAAAGIELMESTTAIQPVLIGDSDTAVAVSEHLQRLGIMALAIRPPTVPVGQSRIRVTLMTDHSQADIAQLVQTLKRALPDN